ncbi:MAG TPA: NADH-ubiquinone oxidoreductase-F iron-sulfur binding region domain-containing protein [Thermodesulfobacteriota bacterium]|jgi:NADH-quinone oxidoreductase subunit F|nr:NADH-ubiquinone oxidoreductase-F iron-sulfur binding region domain-containing protein [Thermodesulfobacteriota bacterium]
MFPQVIFQNRKPNRIATIDEYRQSGGYQALTMALQKYSPKEVQQLVVDANLQGRGGAGFPAGLKWKSVADDAPFPRYLITNIDEMEPGTFKDRIMAHADPHMIIEGTILAGYVVSAEKGIIFVRPSYESSALILEREIRIAQEAGYLGQNIMGSNFSFDLIVHRSGGRYICGEGTAQINAIMGMRAHPKQPPPRSTEKGLWDQPTVLNNIETLVNVPHIVRHGADWFKGLAKTKVSSGTKLYCVSGKVNRPGCYELPMGTPLREIIEEHAGGLLPGSEFKTCLPGGASTCFLGKEDYGVEMDFEGLKKCRNRLGTGAVIVFDQKTCLVGATLNLIEFFVRESCGFCTPCREGLPFIRDLLWRIEHGEGEQEFIPILRRMCAHMWKSYCAFAPGASMPVESLLTYFGSEVQEHISQKKCPFKQ